MKTNIFVLLLGVSLIPFGLSAQYSDLAWRTGLIDYQITFQQDTITYLLSSPSQHGEPDKLILYLQGSIPQPLFIEQADGGLVNTFPVDYYSRRDEFYFCILPKAGLPVVANAKDLPPSGLCLAPDSEVLPVAYQERNYLEYYVGRAKLVLEELVPKLGVTEVIVIGGSEGARVGARLANECDLITHLVYYSANPLGRYFGLITAERHQALMGKQTAEEAEAKIEQLQNRWQVINEDPMSTSSASGDTNRTWTSFSGPALADLLALDIPVLVAYGTADSPTLNMDYLYYEVVRLQKKNIEIRSYIDHDHGLNKLTFDERGEQVSSEFVFDTIYEEWLNWVRAH